MAGDKKNIIYTAADFHRYHAGLMTEAEMHALEKASLEDPFLADALEGYVYTSTAESDIHELKKRILQRDENKKAVAVFRPNYKIWWRAAAIIIFCTGIGYLAWKFNNNDKKAVVAQTKQSKIQDKEKNVNDESNVIVRDSDKIENKSIAANEKTAAPLKSNDAPVTYAWTATDSLKGTDAFAAQQPDTKKSVRRNAAVDEAILKDRTPLQYDTLVASVKLSKTDSVYAITRNVVPGVQTEKYAGVKPEELLSRKRNGSTYYFNGRILDNKGNAIPFASIREKGKKTGFTTDTSGRFSILTTDSIMPATFAALGYVSLDKKLLPGNDHTIVLSPENRALEEVVVTGINRSNNDGDKDNYRKETMSKRRTDNFSATPSQPVAGIENYNLYLADSIRRPLASNGQPYNGEVVLSFRIKRNGEPHKIKVEHSLCKACDEEATRLLRSGPKWKYINNNRVTQVIKF